MVTRRVRGEDEPSTTSIGLPSLSISTRSKRSKRSSRPCPPPPTIESMLKPIFGFDGTGTIGVGASGIIVRLSYAWLMDWPLLQHARAPGNSVESGPPHACTRPGPGSFTRPRTLACQTSNHGLLLENTLDALIDALITPYFGILSQL